MNSITIKNQTIAQECYSNFIYERNFISKNSMNRKMKEKNKYFIHINLQLISVCLTLICRVNDFDFVSNERMELFSFQL
jgi:hypothetical protein